MSRRILSALAALLALFGIAQVAPAAVDPAARGIAAQALAKSPYTVQATLFGLSSARVDNGPAINAAIAATQNGSGRVKLPCGTFNFSTPIVANTKVAIDGTSQYCTILNYTGITGTAVSFTMNYPGSSTYGAIGFGLSDLSLYGPGQNVTATTGVLIGNQSNSANNSGAGFVANRVRIRGFGIGVTWGSGVWDSLFQNSLIDNNNQAVVWPAGLTNAGEQIMFTDNIFADNGFYNNYAACIEIAGNANAFDIKGGSIDDCQIYTHASGANIVVSNLHMEFPAKGSGTRVIPYVNNLGGSVTLRDIDLLVSGSGYSTVAPFVANSANPLTQFVISSLKAVSQYTGSLPSLVSLGGVASLNEWGTKTIYCNGAVQCFDSFAINTGTGRATVSTPGAAMSIAATTTTDPQGNNAASLRYSDPSGNAGAYNMLLQSNAFTTSPWAAYCNAGTASSTDVLDPWGGTSETVWKLTSISAPAGCGTTQTGVTQSLNTLRPAGTRYSASVWVRTLTGTQTFYLGAGAASASTFTATAQWKRFSITDNYDVSRRIFDVHLEGSGATTGGNVIYFCCATVNQGAIPAAYAETTTSRFMPYIRSNDPAAIYGPTTLGSDTNYLTINTQGSLISIGTAPTLNITDNSGTSCGGSGASNTGATNTRGQVTLGGAATTVCSFSFAGGTYAGVSGDAYAPVCIVSMASGGASPAVSSSAAGITVTFGTSQTGSRFQYLCR